MASERSEKGGRAAAIRRDMQKSDELGFWIAFFLFLVLIPALFAISVRLSPG